MVFFLTFMLKFMALRLSFSPVVVALNDNLGFSNAFESLLLLLLLWGLLFPRL